MPSCLNPDAAVAHWFRKQLFTSHRPRRHASPGFTSYSHFQYFSIVTGETHSITE
jgi:hypothetical protein